MFILSASMWQTMIYVHRKIKVVSNSVLIIRMFWLRFAVFLYPLCSISSGIANLVMLEVQFGI